MEELILYIISGFFLISGGLLLSVSDFTITSYILIGLGVFVGFINKAINS